MRRRHRHIERLVLRQRPFDAINDGAGSSLHDDPMLGTMHVTMNRKSSAGIDHEAFDCEAESLIDAFDVPPRPKVATMRDCLSCAFSLKPLDNVLDRRKMFARCHQNGINGRNDNEIRGARRLS